MSDDRVRTALKFRGATDENRVAEWDDVGYFPHRNSRSGVAGLLPLRHLGSTCPLRADHADSPPRCALAFHGTFDHNLDAKNRLTVPSKFRAALSDGVFLTKGIEHCVALYPAATYTALIETTLSRLNPLSPEARDLKRMLYGNATDAELDAAGRVMLPARLLEHAGISREVVVTGAGECLELWDRSTWEAYDTDLTARAPELTASLGHPA
jgi:MraZ protein